MSLITPNSQIKLYSDVEITDGLEIVFKSKAGQDAYFKSKLKASNVTCTYIKKTGKCRIEFPTSTVSQCNFITFTNASFENVTFYETVLKKYQNIYGAINTVDIINIGDGEIK